MCKELGKIGLTGCCFLCFALVRVSSAAGIPPSSFQELSSVPGLQIEMAYKTSGNCVGQSIYPQNARPWADGRVARALGNAALFLEARGYRLVLYDAYRPPGAARELWEIAKRKRMDLRFIADPNGRGSDHSRGAAVDVGLARADGGRVAMPCEFDHFGASASHEYKGATAEESANRAMLRRAMESAGFQAHRDEWWHYVLPSARNNPIVDFTL